MATFGLLRTYVMSLMAPPLVGFNRAVSDAQGFIANSVISVKGYSDSASASASDSDKSAAASLASQNASSASAASAAQSLNTIQGLVYSYGKAWLGSQTSDPTKDLNGDPLIEGARYWNSVNDIIRVYKVDSTGKGAWEDDDADAQQQAKDAAQYAQQAQASMSNAQTYANNSANSAKQADSDAAYVRSYSSKIDIVYGQITVGNAGDYLRVLADGSGLEARTPAQVLSDINSLPQTNAHLLGTPTAPTAGVNTSSQQIANCAFVLGQASNQMPKADTQNGSIGSALTFARADHQHPIDGSRANLNGDNNQPFRAKIFLAGHGEDGTAGFSFYDDYGYDSGMYSTGDGSVDLRANAVVVANLTAGQAAFYKPIQIWGGQTNGTTNTSSFSEALELHVQDTSSTSYVRAYRDANLGPYISLSTFYRWHNTTAEWKFGETTAWTPTGSTIITSDAPKAGQTISGSLNVQQLATYDGWVVSNSSRSTQTQNKIALSSGGISVHGQGASEVSLRRIDASQAGDGNQVGATFYVISADGKTQANWYFRENGTTVVPGKILGAEGSGTAGGYSFYADGNYDTGMFSPSDGVLNLYSNNVQTMNLTSNQVTTNLAFIVNNTLTSNVHIARSPVGGGSTVLGHNGASTIIGQGTRISWNTDTASSGSTEFINYRGLGYGGFYFYNTTPSDWDSNTTTQHTWVARLDNGGIASYTSMIVNASKTSNGSQNALTSPGLTLTGGSNGNSFTMLQAYDNTNGDGNSNNVGMQVVVRNKNNSNYAYTHFRQDGGMDVGGSVSARSGAGNGFIFDQNGGSRIWSDNSQVTINQNSANYSFYSGYFNSSANGVFAGLVEFGNGNSRHLNQGTIVTWNKVQGGSGTTDFFNLHGTGGGGFRFMNGDAGNYDNNNATSLAYLDSGGNLNLLGGINPTSLGINGGGTTSGNSWSSNRIDINGNGMDMTMFMRKDTGGDGQYALVSIKSQDNNWHEYRFTQGGYITVPDGSHVITTAVGGGTQQINGQLNVNSLQSTNTINVTNGGINVWSLGGGYNGSISVNTSTAYAVGASLWMNQDGSQVTGTSGQYNRSSYITQTVSQRSSNFFSRQWCEELVGTSISHVIQVTSGSTSNWFHFTHTGTFQAPYVDSTAARSNYADYAENFRDSTQIQKGSIVCISTDDTTEDELALATRGSFIYGVISDKPGYLINSKQVDGNPVTHSGQTVVLIKGPIRKGSPVTLSDTPGVGEAGSAHGVIGYALKTDLSDGIHLVKVAVGGIGQA